jgi:hypothetical protein
MRLFRISALVTVLFLLGQALPLAAAEKLGVGFPSLATALSPAWVAVKKKLRMEPDSSKGGEPWLDLSEPFGIGLHERTTNAACTLIHRYNPTL